MSSLFDLTDVVANLGSGSYTVTRTVPGGYGSDGRWQPGTPSTLTINASVQPLNGRDLERLPEGERTTERLKVYSATRLFTSGAGQDPDVITVEGVDHQVETAETWGPNGNYWKMIVRSVRRQAP